MWPQQGRQQHQVRGPDAAGAWRGGNTRAGSGAPRGVLGGPQKGPARRGSPGLRVATGSGPVSAAHACGSGRLSPGPGPGPDPDWRGAGTEIMGQRCARFFRFWRGWGFEGITHVFWRQKGRGAAGGLCPRRFLASRVSVGGEGAAPGNLPPGRPGLGRERCYSDRVVTSSQLVNSPSPLAVFRSDVGALASIYLFFFHRPVVTVALGHFESPSPPLRLLSAARLSPSHSVPPPSVLEAAISHYAQLSGTPALISWTKSYRTYSGSLGFFDSPVMVVLQLNHLVHSWVFDIMKRGLS